LKPLGAAFDTEMAGAVSVHLNAEGALDRLRLSSEIEGGDIAAGGAKLDRLRLAHTSRISPNQRRCSTAVFALTDSTGHWRWLPS